MVSVEKSRFHGVTNNGQEPSSRELTTFEKLQETYGKPKPVVTDAFGRTEVPVADIQQAMSGQRAVDASRGQIEQVLQGDIPGSNVVFLGDDKEYVADSPEAAFLAWERQRNSKKKRGA